MLAMCLIYIPYSMVLLCFWLLFWLHYSTFSSFSQIFPLSLISASSLMVLLPPSVHLSICFLLLIQVWVPLQSQLLQLFWMDTNPFPIQLGDLIPPVGGHLTSTTAQSTKQQNPMAPPVGGGPPRERMWLIQAEPDWVPLVPRHHVLQWRV